MAVFEALERRRLLSVTVVTALDPVVVQQDTPLTIDLAGHFDDPEHPGTFVRMTTAAGNIDLELFTRATPKTVENFLNYVNSGAYTNTIFHRSIKDGIVQGGGFTKEGAPIPTNPPVENEPLFSNIKGTIAMAKQEGNPNSATSQFFFNEADNSQILDNANGGFTVFGQVIAGQDVVDQINNLPTVNAGAVNPAFANLPVISQDISLPLQQLFVQLGTVSPLAKLSFVGGTSDVSLLTTSVEGTQLTLNPALGKSGTLQLSVVATDLFGNSVTNIMRVIIKAAPSRTLDVPIGGDAPNSVSFKEEDKDRGAISFVGAGSAVVHFAGDNLQLKGRKVLGDGVQVEGITATGTNASSSINVVGSGKKASIVDIGTITSDGGMKAVHFRKARLVGDLTVAGGLANLNVERAHNSNITIGAPSKPNQKMLFKVGAFEDVNLTTQTPIGLTRAISWQNNDAVAESLKAPSINSLHALGSFRPGIVLSGAPQGKPSLGRLIIPGIAGGTWNIPGKVPLLTIGGIAEDFSATFAEPIKKLKVRTSFLGSITAPSIDALEVGGVMGGAHIDLTAPFDPAEEDLKSLSVKSGITSTIITSAGSIGSIKSRLMGGVFVYAGIINLPSGQDLPQTASDYAADAHIGSVKLKPEKKDIGYISSVLAAKTIGPLSFGTVRLLNINNIYGLAADRIASVAATDLQSKKKFSFKNLDDPAALPAALSEQGITLNDFKILLI